MPDRSADPSAPLLLLGRRTPLARAGTALADVPVHRLLAPILQRLVTETGLAPESAADVVMGNAVGAGGCSASYLRNHSFMTLVAAVFSLRRGGKSDMSAIARRVRVIIQ